ncbi:AMP-binding protein [Chryseobacterium sp. G0201]|uniref:AMP-binding protein n=1 Tax=Chryseobacterium sp. G0201 TaxID=2487065 RepID=UPI000F4E0FF9|nr:AMP-binding protein [Chryseobacterium sp. G0201]AZA53954.1 hypothetical protein EG348_13555 [Chryseobacterium sp. G0201]
MNITKNIIENLLLYNNENQILYGIKNVSGNEIADKIIAFASCLRFTGEFNCGDRVLLIMNDSPEFIYSFLSLISIGCIPVPLNPLIKDSELEYILLDSKATGTIIDNNQYLRLYDVIHNSCYIINDCIIINDPLIMDNGSFNYLQKYLFPQNFSHSHLGLEFLYEENNQIAFWQYTSGTTGNPKAVQHKHNTMLINTELFAQKTLEIVKEDIILSISKMFFGYGLGNSLFFPLITGATVIIDEKWFAIDNLIKNMRLYKPTVLFATPKVYSEILHQHKDFSKKEFNSIRLFMSAGSPLPESIIRQWETIFEKTITNGIGSTEIGHIFMCDYQPKEQSKNASLGVPVLGYDVKISEIDAPYETIENYGEIGELCIYPPKSTLSSYWGPEEFNKIRYKEGWCFSGDLCSQRYDGSYIYHGRKDDLFKVNGRWVNPIEIENHVLQNFKQVHECAITYYLDDDNLAQSVLYVVEKTGINTEVLSDKIQKMLSKNFPTFKAPSRIYFIKELKRNSNGKVNRKRLQDNLT